MIEKGDLVITTDEAIAWGATDKTLVGRVISKGSRDGIIRVWVQGHSIADSWHESFWQKLEDVWSHSLKK